MSAPCLEGRGLTKAFGGITIVEEVDVAVRRGEILTVIGENGAGKSTLMSMLTGVICPDRGEIRLRGELIDLRSPRHAAEAGIAIVHQEHQLVSMQSAADNLMLVRPPAARALRRGTRGERAFVCSMLDRVGLDIEPGILVSALSVAQCQMLEIAKALALDADVIIFDEPTAALLPAEAARLLTLIQELRDQGKALIYISHALDEILCLADRISVLRDGRLVGDFKRHEVDRDRLIGAMVDRPVGAYAYELALAQERVVFRAQQLATRQVRDISFELREGEVLGLAGLMGGGMQDAVLALCGEQATTSGALMLAGKMIRFRSPREAALAGIVMVPEERKQQGIVSKLSVCENMHLGRYGHHARWGWVEHSRLRVAATDLVRRFHIHLASIDQPICTLSGGNQQKALIARCVQTNPRVLIISSPTRGVDIGAKEAIHRIILELAASGTAVVLVSPEIEELLALAHRIAVFSQGRMIQILPRAEATPARILRIAIGDNRAQSDRTSARAA